MDKTNMEIKKKRIFDKEKLKRRLPLAILASFTFSFMVFFFGIIEIFIENSSEIPFAIRDFGIYILLISIALTLIFTLLILFLPEKGATAVFGVVVWLTVMGFIQYLLLNGHGSLSGDTGVLMDTTHNVINAAIWVAGGVIIIGAALLMKKKDFLKPVFIIVLITILVMLITSFVMNVLGYWNKGGEPAAEETGSAETSGTSETVQAEPEVDANDPAAAYLTKDGLTEVSRGKNIIVFVIDRFDVEYYENVIKEYPDLFDGLDGFTYFSDNVSLYSRTYPAATSMITGIDNDFSGTCEDYYMKAYRTSPFLNDLKKNGYSIKLYMPDYYCYREGTPLIGVADNISISTGYKITDKASMVLGMINLSAYRYLPDFFKTMVDVSTATITNTTEKIGGTSPQYMQDDLDVCGQILKDGITLDDGNNSYIYIHLTGCHAPYTMDGNCEPSDDSSAETQLRGCMKMIYSYLDDMKELGVYDDATIVITGDHPAARNDFVNPSEPRLTSLFVKPSGSSGEPLKYSSAQVSQENLIPTLVKSSGIETENDYGTTYFEVPDGQNVKRYHKFELAIDSTKSTQLTVYEVNGDGTDFDNWKIVDNIDIGSLYK